jgi:hypothetical protein
MSRQWHPRKVTTHYECADGVEREITIEVEQEDRYTVNVCSGLDGVPEDEREGVIDRATEAFWAAARAEWLRTPEGEASGQ